MQIQSLSNIKLDPKADFYFGLGAINILALGFLFAFLNPGDIDTDGGIFSAVAFKDLNGGVLYKDAWENKPPGIFYLMEFFFMLIPYKIYALYVMAIFGILAIVNGLYFTIHFLVRSLFLSLLLLIIFLSFVMNSLFLGDGLYTEIFGSACIIWALYALNVYENGKKLKYAYLAALLASFSFWFKEPFVLLTIPILIYLAFKIRQPVIILRMIGFAAIPSLFFILLLVINGSLSGFLDTISYNFTYVDPQAGIAKTSQLQTLWNSILEPLFIPMLIIMVYGWRSFSNGNSRIYAVLNFCLLGGSLLFVLISPHNFNHYYLPFIVVFFYCLASFLNLDKQYFKSSRLIVYVLIFYMLIKMDDKKEMIHFKAFEPYKPDKIAETLLRDRSKTLFIDLVDASEYYIKSEKSYPTFLPVPLAVHFNESAKGLSNRKRIYEELSNNKPDFLLIGESSSYMYWHVPDPLLYYGNYEKIDSTFTRYGKMVFLWKRK